jgi:glycogen operon protein
MRNFLTTLLLSQGVPMLVAGDEIARTQEGNNNAYCQDNEISWIDWNLDERQQRLHEFTRRLIRLRQQHPVFRRTSFLVGDGANDGLPDAWWFRPDGRKMTKRDWDGANGPRLGVFLNGKALGTRTAQGEPVVDDSFLILFNADHEETSFTIPPKRFGARWEFELTTADSDTGPASYAPRDQVALMPRSITLLRLAS